MEKKSWLYALFYVGIALALFGGSMIASRWYFGPRSSPTNSPTQSPPKEGTIQLKASSSRGGVEQHEGPSGRMYYQVKGVFVSGLAPEGQALVGQFVIDGDPNKTPIAVSIDVRTGTANLQIFSQNFEEDGEVSEVSIAALLEKITSGTQGLLLEVFDEKYESSAVRGALDAVTTGSWTLLPGLTLQPETVGIIEKSSR